jgi:hypothetical protein
VAVKALAFKMSRIRAVLPQSLPPSNVKATRAFDEDPRVTTTALVGAGRVVDVVDEEVEGGTVVVVEVVEVDDVELGVVELVVDDVELDGATDAVVVEVDDVELTALGAEVALPRVPAPQAARTVTTAKRRTRGPFRLRSCFTSSTLSCPGDVDASGDSRTFTVRSSGCSRRLVPRCTAMAALVPGAEVL